MQINDGVVTIKEGDGVLEPPVKSRPIVGPFWLKGGRYEVTIPGEGWTSATLDRCQVGRESEPPRNAGSGAPGTKFFYLEKGFYRLMLKGPLELQPRSAEITRLEGSRG